MLPAAAADRKVEKTPYWRQEILLHRRCREKGPMAALSEISEPHWQASVAAASTPRGRQSRGSFGVSTLMSCLAAVAVGLLISYFLASSSGLSMDCTLIAVAAALPILAGWFLKERLRARSLEVKPLRRPVLPEFEGMEAEAEDDMPAGLLIVSSDLRIRFANHAYLDATLQNPEEVLGWRLEDVMPAEGLEDQARALLGRPYAATSCCFTSFPGTVPTERRPVSITMTRIPSAEGEDRILVVVEDLLRNFPACQAPVVEGYIC
jgi:PAS domain-containing protein